MTKTIVKQLRAEIAEAHPVVYTVANGQAIPFTAEEREAWLDEQAEIAFADKAGWERLRSERDRLLAAADWTQISDAPVDAKAWAAYRQALRDFPATINTIEELENPVWPEPPNN